MSSWFPKMASTAAGPALKVWVLSVTLEPRSFWKMLLATPTNAVAWVRLGKYPRRRVTGPDEAVEVPVELASFLSPPPPQAAATRPKPTTTTAKRRPREKRTQISLVSGVGKVDQNSRDSGPGKASQAPRLSLPPTDGALAAFLGLIGRGHVLHVVRKVARCQVGEGRGLEHRTQ